MTTRQTEHQNIGNDPEHIISACKRVLPMVRDPKLRKQIKAHINKLREQCTS